MNRAESPDIVKLNNVILNMENEIIGKSVTFRPYSPMNMSTVGKRQLIGMAMVLVDTGADCPVISLELVKSLQLEIKPTPIKANDAGD